MKTALHITVVILILFATGHITRAQPDLGRAAGRAATWTVTSMAMESRFPNGIRFSIHARSASGKIRLAVVNWQFAPYDVFRKMAPIDSAGRAQATWVPDVETRAPQWVSVEYWWSLQDEKGNTYDTPHQFGEYVDNRRPWSRLESDDAIVFWQQGVPDEIGVKTLESLKMGRPEYLRTWGKLLDYRPRIIVYADYRAFDEWLPGADHPDSTGNTTISLTSRLWGATVQVYLPGTDISSIAAGSALHEIDHLYQYASGTRITVRDACWFIEGDATYFERKQQYDYLERAHQLVTSNQLPRLRDITTTCGKVNWRDAYDTGYAFFVWLNQTYGPEAHRQIWDRLGQDQALDETLQAVTGLSFDEMEQSFRAWLLKLD